MDDSHQVNASQRVVAAVIRRDSGLLVCQRPAHKRHGGLWEFPGGKCEPGESDAAAVARELLEELGVRTHVVGATQFTVADQDSPFVIAFVDVEIEGDPVCIEHDAITWGQPQDLLALHLAPSDRRFVEFLLGAS